MHVEGIDDLPAPLGRDAYRIVQEALTNVGKHARGTAARVRVTGAPDDGLHISVRNRQPVPASHGSDAARLRVPACSGCRSGSRWRAAPCVLGPDGSGDFVVEAELTWRP